MNLRWVAALFWILLPAVANADGPAFEALLRSPIARAALETREGRRLFRALGLERGDVSGLLRISEREAAQPLRAALEESLARIEREAETLRELRRNNGNPLAEGRVTTEERFLVEILSRRLLTLERPRLVSRIASGEPVDFVGGARGGYVSTARIFREYEGARAVGPGEARAPGLGLETERAAEAAAGAARGELAESAPGVASRFGARFRNFMEEMRLCKLRQPPVEARNHRLQYFAMSLAVNEAIIVGGYVAGMGEQAFSWEELTTDMITGAVFTTANIGFLRPNQRFLVQWIRVTGGIIAQDGVDAVIYYVSPLHRIRTGESRHTPEEAYARFGFNGAYTLASSGWREVVTYELITGLRCLYPGSRWATLGTTGIRMADSAMSALIYFRARREVLGH